MNLAMNSTLEETFEYRHKKFDQLKGSRNESISSSDEYECIKVEIERLEERPYSQTSSEISTTSNWSTPQTYINPMANLKRQRVISASESLNSVSEGYTGIQTSAAKRMRTSSSASDSSYSTSFSASSTPRHTSTPYTTTTNLPLVSPVGPSTAAILPKISDETLRSICKYHGNMVRKFPKVERTPKDQDRRNKNTIACRMSRRVKKLEHIAIEEQYKDFSQQSFDIIERSMRATAYLHELMKLSAGPKEAVPSLESHTQIMALNDKPLTGPKKPFTIAFLTGKEE